MTLFEVPAPKGYETLRAEWDQIAKAYHDCGRSTEALERAILAYKESGIDEGTARKWLARPVVS